MNYEGVIIDIYVVLNTILNRNPEEEEREGRGGGGIKFARQKLFVVLSFFCV